MVILIVLMGGLLFLYFNIKCLIKVNITFYFLHIYFYIIILKKKYAYERTINYFVAQKIINRYKNPEIRYRFKNHLKYYKHLKKIFRLFYIKNIQIYNECVSEKQSFAVEFVIVNSILKKSLLNG